MASSSSVAKKLKRPVVLRCRHGRLQICEIDGDPPEPLPSLPPEIIDMIIDHLYANKHSLASLSVVCKSWSATSRYYLFQHTILYATKQDSLEELENFIRFLDATPNACSYIKILDLRGSRSPARVRTQRMTYGTKIDAPILSSIVQKLPSLSILRLSHFLLSATTSPAVETNPKFLNQAFCLDELSFDNVKRAPEATDNYEIIWVLVHIIGLFRETKTLQYTRIGISMPESLLPRILQMVSAYTHTHGKIRISDIKDVVLPGWLPLNNTRFILTRLLDLSALRSASLQCNHPEDMLCIAKLLEGHLVESLSISIYPAFWQLNSE